MPNAPKRETGPGKLRKSGKNEMGCDVLSQWRIYEAVKGHMTPGHFLTAKKNKKTA